MPTIITAGGASDSLALSSGNDGLLTLQTGPSGAKVNALAFASDGTPTFAKARGGVAQIQTFSTGAVATGSTAIPDDDTIPQITEGNQFVSLAITPISASSLLEVDVVLVGSHTIAIGNMIALALFRDSGANAVAVSSFETPGNGSMFTLVLKYLVTSGSTASTTFTARVGASSGTYTLNGVAGARKYGGAVASSITIKEYLP